MTHVERIEQNKKLEGLSERKGGIEDHMSFLREYIGTGNPNIFRYHGSIYVYLNTLVIVNVIVKFYII